MRINVYGIRGFPGIQGGVEKHCEELYPRMASKDVVFKVFRRKPYVSADDSSSFAHIEFADTWAIKNKYLETPLHSLFSAFRTIRDRPDLVHIHNIAASFTIPLLKLFGRRCIVTFHSANYEHAKWNWFAKLVIRACEKIVFMFADKVIFVSSLQKEKSSLKDSKKAFIPNGIPDFAKLKPSITLSKFRLKKGSFILSVGRIVPEKRFPDLIEAFSNLVAEKKFKADMKLVIAGGYDNLAGYFKELNKYKEKLGNKLVFTGFLSSSDLKLLYENAFCFVLPSENEGMPIVLLEAMSFGLCPLASDIPQNMELIKEAGFSFKCKDVSDLEDKLLRMINNPGLVKQRGIACKKLVKDSYQWGLVAKKTLAAYDDAVGGNKDKIGINRNKREN